MSETLTPTARVIGAANTSATVTASDGRQITVRKFGVMDRLDFFELIGPENSENKMFLGTAMPAYLVTQIDGAPCPTPTSMLALRGVLGRLDEAGIEAAQKAVTLINTAKSAEQTVSDAKN